MVGSLGSLGLLEGWGWRVGLSTKDSTNVSSANTDTNTDAEALVTVDKFLNEKLRMDWVFVLKLTTDSS